MTKQPGTGRACYQLIARDTESECNVRENSSGLAPFFKNPQGSQFFAEDQIACLLLRSWQQEERSRQNLQSGSGSPKIRFSTTRFFNLHSAHLIETHAFQNIAL